MGQVVPHPLNRSSPTVTPVLHELLSYVPLPSPPFGAQSLRRAPFVTNRTLDFLFLL